MIVSMRESGLSHNSVATYVRTMKAFLTWCRKEGIADISIDGIREKDVVKETYSDEEIALLLRKPKRDCDFCEYRSWVIVNFLLNSGCRAATVRNIKIADVNLQGKQIVLRHTKNKSIQVIPLCSFMVNILKDYMDIRNGADEDFLFCDQFGQMLTENALKLSIKRYNRRRYKLQDKNEQNFQDKNAQKL